MADNLDRISKQLVALADSVESLTRAVETTCDAELRRSEARGKALLTILAILERNVPTAALDARRARSELQTDWSQTA